MTADEGRRRQSDEHLGFSPWLMPPDGLEKLGRNRGRSRPRRCLSVASSLTQFQSPSLMATGAGQGFAADLGEVVLSSASPVTAGS